MTCSTLDPGAIQRSRPFGGTLDHRKMTRVLPVRRQPRAVGQRRPWHFA